MNPINLLSLSPFSSSLDTDEVLSCLEKVMLLDDLDKEVVVVGAC